MSGEWDAVVPAGGEIGGTYAARAGTPSRALAPVGTSHTPVVQIVAERLKASARIGRVICVADEPVQREIFSNVDLWLPDQGSGPANILHGLKAARKDQPAVLCTSDLPFLTDTALEDFFAHTDTDADLNIGIVRADAYLKAFPDAPPSEFVTLREVGPITMACVFLLKPAWLERSHPQLERAFGSRKSQWRTAAMLGPKLIWQWLRHTLSLADLTAHAQKTLNCRVHVLHNVDPALAFDIDTLEDYEYAQHHF